MAHSVSILPSYKLANTTKYHVLRQKEVIYDRCFSKITCKYNNIPCISTYGSMQIEWIVVHSLQVWYLWLEEVVSSMDEVVALMNGR